MTKNNIFLRNTVPDVITIGQRFRQQGYQSVRIGKFFITIILVLLVPPELMIFIHGIKQLILMRDKWKNIKLIPSPRRYGGSSWMSSDGVDEEQTDGIAVSEAIKKLENFFHILVKISF